MKRGLLTLLCLILLAVSGAACRASHKVVAPSATAVLSEQAPTSTAATSLAPTERPTNAPTATAAPTATPLPDSTAVGLVNLPNATMAYYDVSGATAGELRAHLDALGPVDDGGYKGDALTKWDIQWSWPGYGSSSCNLGAVTVTYQIEVEFPRWIPPEDATPGLAVRWADYTGALAKHEKGHVDNVVANYTSVAEAIEGATCQTAEAEAQAALAPIRQRDIDYDAATRHGATQGAVFP